MIPVGGNAIPRIAFWACIALFRMLPEDEIPVPKHVDV